MSSTGLVVDSREIDFILHEWLNVKQLQKYPRYTNFDEDTFKDVVKGGHEFAKEVMSPCNSEGDRVGSKFVDGEGIAPACYKEPYNQAHEQGWSSLTVDEEWGGMNAPMSLGLAVSEGTLGANLALQMYFGLTQGAMELIESFGSQELKEKYCTRMTSGEFSGTMCISEPHAGSDVGAGTTIAEKIEGAKYSIKGTKCWISSGDNDLSSNVIHLVLGRVKGAPEGTKGLSLFVVPKISVSDEDGSLGERNDVTLVSLEHKMGIKGSATAVLSFGDNGNCEGVLLGNEGEGMRQMFQMMNGARMGVAAMGLALGSAAYQNALAYSKERLQFQHINKMGDATAERVAIIEHPDVKLMMAGMKARIEAMRALVYATSLTEDKVRATEDDKEREEMDDLFQILTPLCKAWATEVGLDICRTSMQVLGGVGYTQDFPVEQYYRDLRISAIYEGTTGIQGLDLVGRKMTMKKGKLFMNLIGKFGALYEENKEHAVLGKSFEAWKKSYDKMIVAAMMMQEMMKEKGMEGAVLYATPFLHFLSAVTAMFYLLQQGLIASEKLEALKAEKGIESEEQVKALVKENSDARFYYNKIKTIEFFLAVVMPTYQSLSIPMTKKDYTTFDFEF